MSDQQQSGSILYKVLALLCLGSLVWIWTKTSRDTIETTSKTTSPLETNAALPGATNVASSNVVAVLAKTNLTNVVIANLPSSTIITSIVKTNITATNGVLLTNGTNLEQSSVQSNFVAQTNVPQVETSFTSRPVQNVFEAQLVLARRGISSGSLDGILGSQTRAAIRVFQEKENLPATGELDLETKNRLRLSFSPYRQYVISSNDLARLQSVKSTWRGKASQSVLDYETALELVAEKHFAHPNFIQRLNPTINSSNVLAGTVFKVPNVERPLNRAQAALIRVRLSDKTLQAFDGETNLLLHFPCSIAQRVEKRPIGELHVAVVAANPNYVFDPDNFPESAEARAMKKKLILPPGPNNPVGTAWIGLDKPGYGIHGTPKPEEVGRTESHGCFRLANWNAEALLRIVRIGIPVIVEP